MQLKPPVTLFTKDGAECISPFDAGKRVEINTSFDRSYCVVQKHIQTVLVN